MPGVSVTTRALRVLEAFSPHHRVLGLTDIARRAGLPVSTAHRLVADLAAWGALERADDGRYRIGLRLWEVATLAPRGSGSARGGPAVPRGPVRGDAPERALAVRDGTEALVPGAPVRPGRGGGGVAGRRSAAAARDRGRAGAARARAGRGAGGRARRSARAVHQPYGDRAGGAAPAARARCAGRGWRSATACSTWPRFGRRAGDATPGTAGGRAVGGRAVHPRRRRLRPGRPGARRRGVSARAGRADRRQLRAGSSCWPQAVFMACSTSAMRVSLAESRRRASQRITGTPGSRLRASWTSAGSYVRVPSKQLTATMNGSAAPLEVVDRREAVGQPAGVGEHDRPDRAERELVPDEQEPVLPGRAEQVEHQVVVERDAAEVHRHRGGGLRSRPRRCRRRRCSRR